MILASLFMFMVAGGPLIGYAVLYLLPMLLVCAAAFYAVAALCRESLARGRDLELAGELPYGFAGQEIRAFSDDDGQVWLRARDVRHVLGLERTDSWMARAYPDGYRRAHPGLAAWYVRPVVVRRHWGGSTRPRVNRFLNWLERELVPLQERRHAAAGEGGSQRAAAEPGREGEGLRYRVASWFIGHWRGKTGLTGIVLSALPPFLLFALLWGDAPAPADLVEHYRRYAVMLIVTLVGGTLLCAWWGVGVWRATRRWFGGDRALLVGILLAMGGMTALLYAFDRMANCDSQMTVLALAVIAADAGPKPMVTLSADGRRLVLSGEMGFGTTKRVRGELARHPGVEGIELAGPGGSAAEGLALAALLRDRGLKTYVRSDCASACVLAFAGGRERLVGPSARLGLHRSGVDWRRDDGKPSATDRAMAGFLLVQGVTDDFVARILRTPFRELWVPTIEEVIAGGLGSAPWDMSES